MWPGTRPGCVASTADAGGRRPPLEQAVPLRARRCAVSFVAFLCDDDAAQRVIPQFIVANKRVASPGMVARWGGASCEPVRLLRMQSAWLRGPGLSKILREVAAALRPVVAGRRVVLSMDACPVHLCPEVLRTAARCGMHVLPLAAQMTKYLQPLDVGAFLPLKQRYRCLYERQQLLELRGVLAPERALRLLAEAAQSALVSGSWGETFRRCGLSPAPPSSARFLEALGPAPLPVIEPAIPTLADLELILPRNRFVSVGDLFRPFLRPSPAPALRPPGRSRPSRLPEPPRPPLTRSASAALLAAAASPSPAPIRPAAAAAASSSSAAPPPRHRVPVGDRLPPCPPTPRRPPARL